MSKHLKDSTNPTINKNILISEEQTGMMIWLGNNATIKKTAGQVFHNKTSAMLGSVAVLPQIALPGSKLLMELYHFDAATKNWGEKIAVSERLVQHSDCEAWLFFTFASQTLQPEQWYGFKIICTEGQVAIAEGMHGGSNSKANSMQWTSSPTHEAGHFHHDFHLAYKISSAA